MRHGGPRLHEAPSLLDLLERSSCRLLLQFPLLDCLLMHQTEDCRRHYGALCSGADDLGACCRPWQTNALGGFAKQVGGCSKFGLLLVSFQLVARNHVLNAINEETA